MHLWLLSTQHAVGDPVCAARAGPLRCGHGYRAAALVQRRSARDHGLGRLLGRLHGGPVRGRALGHCEGGRRYRWRPLPMRVRSGAVAARSPCHRDRSVHARRSGFPQAGNHPDAVEPDGAKHRCVGAVGPHRRDLPYAAPTDLAFPRLQRRSCQGARERRALRLLHSLHRPESGLLQGQSQRRPRTDHRRLRRGRNRLQSMFPDRGQLPQPVPRSGGEQRGL